ncbi:hypothetical protein QYE76_025699 [Lolium multiflorum]|uniref:CCHC-type domain-containing protein n=1 Tax=Lolium multiflorum TaxID=4521 RepID=A0AAD8RFX6_LOLMU|nr:hypothetical protein QYE76_025699 [Lolium multiflorum]
MAEQETVVNGSPSLEPPAPSSPIDSTTATLDDLKKLESSIVAQMKAMMMELVVQKPNPPPIASAEVPPPKANTLPLVDFVAEATKDSQKEGVGDTGTSTKGKDDDTPVAERQGGYHAVPPPNDYTINVPIPMPHILSHGSPPLLESNNFENWQFLMRSHVRSASTELWRIIEEGYSPRDPKKMTRRDVVDDQLNATAINMIHMAISPKDRAHIRSIKTAKEAWDKLEKLFLGNASIQSSRFDEVNNMADNFVMIEGETPEEMYRRLIALAVQMQDLGATFVDDHWIKRKFYNALLPYEEVKLTAIRQNAFRAMTSDEVLSEVIALDISKKNAEDLVARAHNSRKPNLALKMRVHEASESDEDPVEWGSDDLKFNYHEHMALAAKKFWDGNMSQNTRPRRSQEIKELEAQVLSLKKDLEKRHEGKSALDKMLSVQQSPNDKSGLGFNSNNKNKSKSKSNKKKGQDKVKDSAKLVCFKCKVEGHHVRSCPLKKKKKHLSEKQQGKRPQGKGQAHARPQVEDRPLPKKNQDIVPQEKKSIKKRKGNTCYLCREKGHFASSCLGGTLSNPIIVDNDYSLGKDKDGNVFAKFVGTQSGFKKRTIWVAKPIVTNLLGPNLVGDQQSQT